MKVPVDHHLGNMFAELLICSLSIRTNEKNKNASNTESNVLFKGEKADVDKAESFINRLLKFPADIDSKEMKPLSVISSSSECNYLISLIDYIATLGNVIIVRFSIHSTLK